MDKKILIWGAVMIVLTAAAFFLLANTEEKNDNVTTTMPTTTTTSKATTTSTKPTGTTMAASTTTTTTLVAISREEAAELVGQVYKGPVAGVRYQDDRNWFIEIQPIGNLGEPFNATADDILLFTVDKYTKKVEVEIK